MEDLFLAVFGLPLHPLAVHFAVVLFPLSLLLFLLVLFIPKLRTRFTLWVALLVTSTTPTVVLAQQSGLALSDALYIPNPHAVLGTILVAASVVTAGIVLLLGWSIRKNWSLVLQRSLGFLSVSASIASMIMTVAVGHSGSKASWGGVLQ